MKTQDLQMINSPGLYGDLDRTAEMILKAVRDGELTGEVKFDIWAIPQREPVLDKAKEAAKRFAAIKAKLRGCGLKVGITVQFVLHGDRGCTVSDAEEFPRCIDIGGKPTRRICPLGKNIQKYTYDIFRVFAQAGPDMLDMDEDIRLESRKECFCPEHMKHFNKLKGGVSGPELSFDVLVPRAVSVGAEELRIKLTEAFRQYPGAPDSGSASSRRSCKTGRKPPRPWRKGGQRSVRELEKTTGENYLMFLSRSFFLCAKRSERR